MVVATQEACTITTCMGWILITGIDNVFYCVQSCGCTLHVCLCMSLRGNYLFWSDARRNNIIRSRLDNTEREVLVTGGMSCVC